jgi:hypothetical protein
MGVRLLNTLIRNKYNKKNVIHIKELKDKKIAIDTNLYIYKYMNSKNIIETFYKLCNLFIKYKVQPIFIFDGEIPEEKKEEINIRKEKKKQAEKEHDKLLNSLSDITDVNEIEKVLNRINILKTKFVRVKRELIKEIKLLIEAFGLTTVYAPDEGEKLCSYLEINNIIDGVLTEDSDVFVYGCKNVYTNINIKNETIYLYNYESILNNLNITRNELMYLCVISNNDYNHNNINIITNYNNWIEYKKNNIYNKSLILTYLLENFTRYNITLSNINNMYNIYTFYNNTSLTKYNKIKIYNKRINIDNIKEIMEKYKFIFI